MQTLADSEERPDDDLAPKLTTIMSQAALDDEEIEEEFKMKQEDMESLAKGGVPRTSTIKSRLSIKSHARSVIS